MAEPKKIPVDDIAYIEYTALTEIKDYLDMLANRLSIGEPTCENGNLYLVIARRLVEISTELDRFRDGIASILLLSDDYTRNQNERFAMISTRARELLNRHGEH